MKEINTLISFLQTYGILLVVLGHSFYAYGYDNVVYKWIYSFHMPLFMFISGYLLKYSLLSKKQCLKGICISAFLTQKIRRLLIPYVVISSITFFPKIILSSIAARPLELSLFSYIKSLLYPWDNVIVFFWFLPTLFLIFVIVVCGAKLLSIFRIRIPIVLLVLISFLLHLYNPLENVRILNLEGVVYYLIYFILGYVVCLYKLENLLKMQIKLITFISFSLSILFVFIEVKGCIAAINGIILSLCLGYIYKKCKHTFFHLFFGASSTIYLLSWFPQVASQQILLTICPSTPWWISMFLAIFTGMLFPLYIYKWVMNHKNNKITRFIAPVIGL